MGVGGSGRGENWVSAPHSCSEGRNRQSRRNERKEREVDKNASQLHQPFNILIGEGGISRRGFVKIESLSQSI